MATFWEIAAHSVDHVFSFVVWLFVMLVVSNSGFVGWVWVLVALVPDLCVLLTFKKRTSVAFLKYLSIVLAYKSLINNHVI